MNVILFKQLLELLTSDIPFGCIITNGGKTVSSSNYKLATGREQFESDDTILSYSEYTHKDIVIPYKRYKKNSNRVIYSTQIGNSDTVIYNLETDIINEACFERYKPKFFQYVAIIKQVFVTEEEVANLQYLKLTNSITGEAKYPVYKNSLSILKVLLRTYAKVYIGKLRLQNKQEIINVYGTLVFEKIWNEVYRQLCRINSLLPDTLPNEESIHPYDNHTFLIANISGTKVYDAIISDLILSMSSFAIDGMVFPLKFNVAIAEYPTLNDISKMLQLLDIGLDHLRDAKSTTNSENVSIYMHDERGKSVANTYELSEDLRVVINKLPNEFIVVYQPKVNIKTGTIIGAEGLVRWFSSKRSKQVFPSDFIPILEQTGLIKDLGRIVFDKVNIDSIKLNYEYAKTLKLNGVDDINDLSNPKDISKLIYLFQKSKKTPFRLGVNVSAVQFSDYDFINHIEQLYRSSHCIPQFLDLEVTESVAVVDINDTINKLKRLRAVGFTISLDDFGTGYSSLNYLKNIPLDNLKIDKSFVDNCTNKDQFCDAIIEISRRLGLATIAEGVETVEQRDLLASYNCDYVQGYLYYKPIVFSTLLDTILEEVSNTLQ